MFQSTSSALKSSLTLLLTIFSPFLLHPTSAALYEGALEGVHFAPRAREVYYSPLAGIQALNHENVTEVYVKVLECTQLVQSLKNEMGKRLNESVPPPHRHCFISERNLTSLHAYNHNTTQALRCDQHMLASFPSALQRAIMHEGVAFHNNETLVLNKIKNMVESIQGALANFTGVVVNESTAMGPADVEACEDYLVTDAVLSGGERERTGQLQSSRSDEPPLPPPNADPTDISFLSLQDSFDQPEEPEEDSDATPTAEDATPTATTPTRCSAIENNEDQFIYVTELWTALYYLSLDLQQQRNCLVADA